MFTLDQVTAVQAVLRLAGYHREVRFIAEHDRLILLLADEALIALRHRSGDDLDHVLAQILRTWVVVRPASQADGDPFDLTVLERPQLARPSAAPTDNATETAVSVLSVEEGFRAAYFMTEQYVAVEEKPDDGLVAFREYLDSDPARWSDWQKAVAKALSDPSAASQYLRDFRFRFAAPGDGAPPSAKE